MRLELDQVLHRTIETIAFIGVGDLCGFVSPCYAICKRTRLAKQRRASAPSGMIGLLPIYCGWRGPSPAAATSKGPFLAVSAGTTATPAVRSA